MENVTLQKIDASNYLDCFRLELGQGQERFVSHPIRSLAQAYVYSAQCTPFGIYSGNVMVGYEMVIYDDDENTYNLWHLMIDKASQGKGYGKKAVELALDYIRTQPFGSSHQVLITVNPENTVAWKLYDQLGFSPTGRSDENEIELHLTLEDR